VREVNEFVPYYQSVSGWEKCSDLCPYKVEKTGTLWDSLYTTDCPNSMDDNGFCRECDDFTYQCSVCSDTSDKKRGNVCSECSSDVWIEDDHVSHTWLSTIGFEWWQ
jgi:hypothetical protein